MLDRVDVVVPICGRACKILIGKIHWSLNYLARVMDPEDKILLVSREGQDDIAKRVQQLL